MHKLSLHSKLGIKLLLLAIICIVPISSCSSAKNFDQYEKFCIVQDTETPTNEKWAHYLYTHFSKRCTLPELVTEKLIKDNRNLLVKIAFDPSMGNQYKIDSSSNVLKLSSGNEQVMTWLIYQFISKVAESDSRFTASDLPPAAIEMESTMSEFPFEFRGIYSPSNANEDMLPITASHHVDYNWGLWGHNLWKIVGQNPNPEIYAEVNGKKEESQYCFSSDALYKYIETYISEQWGEGKKGNPVRFTIMPMDNRLVCTCNKCKAAGNTSTSATPAVTNMLIRLAKRFPNQMFFTSAYATTAKRPTQSLPANVGALVSAMDIPMAYDFKNSKEFADFDASLKAWQKLTPEVYIWDYSRNFDDYLTPYPCLNIMQQRLQYYAELGIKGVFINGSGEDYSTFDDLQTAALQALLINPELDIKQYIASYFKRFYPKTADILINYYQSLEDKTLQANVELPYYGGIADALDNYLDAEEFNTFRTTLDKAAKSSAGSERSKLNKLLTGLCFTPLEIMRQNDKDASLDKATDLLDILGGYDSFADMTNYKEALGPLETYIEQWNDDAQHAPAGDLLKGKKFVSATTLSDNGNTAAMLSDGLMGFYTDYHAHWVVSKAQWNLTIPATTAKTLKISLLVAPAWHIWLPQQITVTQNGKTIATWSTSSTPEDKTLTERQFVELNISNANASQPLNLQMTPVKLDRATIGCDEIMGF